MGKYIAIILSLFLHSYSSATEQTPDIVNYNGVRYAISSFTIESCIIPPKTHPHHDEVIKFINESRKGILCSCSACWRGYIAHFEIKNSQFFLFGRILADWISFKNEPIYEEVPFGIAYDEKGKQILAYTPKEWRLGDEVSFLDVEKGNAKITKIKPSHDRESYLDAKQRYGVKYNPDLDNLDDWYELGFLADVITDYWHEENYGSLEILNKIISKKRVKTRGVVFGRKLWLPPTISTQGIYNSYLYIPCELPDDTRVEVEIENPLTEFVKVVSVRELKKSESIHNIKNPKAIEPLSRDVILENCFTQAKKGTIDETKIKVFCDESMSDNKTGVFFVINYNNAKDDTIIAGGSVDWYHAYDKSGRIKHGMYEVKTKANERALDIRVYLPKQNLKNANFKYICHLENKNLLEDNFPKVIMLGGIEVWRAEKETNKVFKFLTSTHDNIAQNAKSLSDAQAICLINSLNNTHDISNNQVGLKILQSYLLKRIRSINFGDNQSEANKIIDDITKKYFTETCRIEVDDSELINAISRLEELRNIKK